MKKIFQLQQENKKPERVIEATKHEIRKYIKRERGKKLPDGMDYWDFESRFGQESESAMPMKSAEIIAALDSAMSDGWSHCYVEIIATATKKRGKSTPTTENDSTQIIE